MKDDCARFERYNWFLRVGKFPRRGGESRTIFLVDSGIPPLFPSEKTNVSEGVSVKKWEGFLNRIAASPHSNGMEVGGMD
jgi:hypothetical protein